MISHLKLQLFWWFRQKGVTMMPGVKPVAVTAQRLDGPEQAGLQADHRGGQHRHRPSSGAEQGDP